ncbi:MAG: 16S rRNA (cytidine(1402)-2'-O)-methyltransferase [Clostridia bacterium]|nr:16S rRNA (cytidine(1402)-2'-O)-methyltransferase [Clostridia bacterium]
MLYFVATPIGNLKDISLRALEVLKSVDIIACEDTRKTSILLNHYDIHKRLISYHKNNETASAEGIVKLLESGQTIAVVSDAGMPVISDPGNILVKKLQENNLPYSVVPGANAGLSALLLSGFDASKFMFVGFLIGSKKSKLETLENLKNLDATLIFYVAPHDVLSTLEFLHCVLGARRVCLVKEITKMFETFESFAFGEMPQMELKGEFVLLVEGAGKLDNPLANLTLEEQIEFYVSSGLDKKSAIKKVAKENKIKNIYKVLENNK